MAKKSTSSKQTETLETRKVPFKIKGSWGVWNSAGKISKANASPCLSCVWEVRTQLAISQGLLWCTHLPLVSLFQCGAKPVLVRLLCRLGLVSAQDRPLGRRRWEDCWRNDRPGHHWPALHPVNSCLMEDSHLLLVLWESYKFNSMSYKEKKQTNKWMWGA